MATTVIYKLGTPRRYTQVNNFSDVINSTSAIATACRADSLEPVWPIAKTPEKIMYHTREFLVATKTTHRA